jgi:hypothetical protein
MLDSAPKLSPMMEVTPEDSNAEEAIVVTESGRVTLLFPDNSNSGQDHQEFRLAVTEFRMLQFSIFCIHHRRRLMEDRMIQSGN